MDVIEENTQRIVLVDESQRVGIWGRAMATVASGGIVVFSVYLTGLIPNTELHELVVSGGFSMGWWVGMISANLLMIGIAAALLLSAYLRTYPRLIIDKGAGQLRIERIRYRTPRTTRSVELARIRRAVVVIGERGDGWELQFELESGESLE